MVWFILFIFWIMIIATFVILMERRKNRKHGPNKNDIESFVYRTKVSD